MKKSEKKLSFKITLLIWAIKLLPNWKWLQRELCRLTLMTRLEARNAFFGAKSEKGTLQIFDRWLSLSSTFKELKDCLFTCRSAFGTKEGSPQFAIVQKMLRLMETPDVEILVLLQSRGSSTSHTSTTIARKMFQGWVTDPFGTQLAKKMVEGQARQLFAQALRNKDRYPDTVTRQHALLAWEHAVGTEAEGQLWDLFCQYWPQQN